MRWRTDIATSFADPADVERFRACKAEGKSDQFCFRIGDNGVGYWGDDTTADRPMCALPRDEWAALGKRARGRVIEVRRGGVTVACELRDTMPWRRNIRNGAGIDLNPAACAALGLTPPIKTRVEWRWTS